MVEARTLSTPPKNLAVGVSDSDSHRGQPQAKSAMLKPHPRDPPFMIGGVSQPDDQNYSSYQNRTYASSSFAASSSSSSSYWNSPITDYIAGALVNISFIYILFISIFLFAELLKRKSQLRTSYYILIFVGTVTYLIVIILWNFSYLAFVGDITSRKQMLSNLSLSAMGRWYYSFEVGIWNLFLALNRATALIYPVKYERYWSYKKLAIYVILILAYPFIVDSYSFFDECRFKVYGSRCRQFRLTDQWYAAALTSIKAVVSVVITIFALWMARKRGSLASSKIEKRLTLQTLSASILLIAFSMCELLAVLYYDTEDNDLYYFFNSLSDLLYSLYYYPVIAIMFVVCPTFRSKFFEFYIPKCFRCKSTPKKKPSNIIATQTITIFNTSSNR